MPPKKQYTPQNSVTRNSKKNDDTQANLDTKPKKTQNHTKQRLKAKKENVEPNLETGTSNQPESSQFQQAREYQQVPAEHQQQIFPQQEEHHIIKIINNKFPADTRITR
ncbi:10754_t:CDS:2 [Funneliformis geosporum]|uniref:3657_t:CDS:1 n=1 Tax=Funneliformis geosporum TaxID=1117311 RepID=A0A9W4X5W6_9GLOM|nr:3657_t:CDS:2 [Funneliformis geosporum]CAI2189144.1 10754_t:CDS:2 [Funneliformis geosporum]